MDLYDDIRFHTAEDYPADLPEGRAATHMGMYFAWAVERNLYATTLEHDFGEALAQLRAGKLSGGQFLLQYRDGQLKRDDFNLLGQRFSDYYYADDDEGYGAFMDDYVSVFQTPALPSFYHVDDSRANRDRIGARFSQRLALWQYSLNAGAQ